MPGVVTNSRSRPLSLKNPLSRATSTGRSCTAFMIATWGFVEVSWVAMPFSYADRRSCGAGDPPMIHLASEGVNALAAVAIELAGDGERALEPRGRQVVVGDLLQRLEHLELVALLRDPEHRYGLDRRAARHGAGDFQYVNRRVERQREALARPFLDALDRLDASGVFPGGTEHPVSVAEA